MEKKESAYIAMETEITSCLCEECAKNIKGDQAFPPWAQNAKWSYPAQLCCRFFSKQINLPWCYECVYLWKDVKLSLMDIGKMKQVRDTKQKLLDVLDISSNGKINQ